MTTQREAITLDLPDGDVVYYPSFFERAASDGFYQTLAETTAWSQEQIKLYGKSMDVPRLTAWYGDPGAAYSYSNIKLEPLPWMETLLTLKWAIEAVSDVTYNSVLLNYYRHERDSVGWHSDDEPELGKNPVIGSVSLGGTRTFQLRHKKQKELKRSLELTHGSLLLMRGSTQHHWLHQVPKSAGHCEPRINLTFRTIIH